MCHSILHKIQSLIWGTHSCTIFTVQLKLYYMHDLEVDLRLSVKPPRNPQRRLDKVIYIIRSFLNVGDNTMLGGLYWGEIPVPHPCWREAH